MSNSDKVLNAGNKLKSYSVKIGSIDLVKEVISSIEISFRNDVPVVLGRVVFNDLYDMNSQLVWRDVSVKVFYMDMFDKSVDMEFYITEIKEVYDDSFKKNYVLELQDKFSYTLGHSYLSKSFKADPVTALKKYIDELKLSSYKTDFDSVSSSSELVVPCHVDNLTFFLGEFYRRGYSFYQTKEKIVIKHIDKLRPKSLPENDPGKPYKNETDNQLYKNKITAMKTFFLRRDAIPAVTKTVAYNPATKTMASSTDNDNSAYYLSDDAFNLQNVTPGGGFHGTKVITQSHLNLDQHRLVLKDSFVRQSEVEIIVNGYVKNDVNQIYELELKGNQAGGEQQAKGNTVIGGKYVSNTVMDKIVGDAIVQKIHLCRADLTKKI
jgi:hypothetical protein